MTLRWWRRCRRPPGHWRTSFSHPAGRPSASSGLRGGLTGDEEDAAIAAGCVPVLLARSVLRTETAAAAALAVLASRSLNAEGA